MCTYKVLVITDPNRKALRIYFTENIAELLKSLKTKEDLFKSMESVQGNFRIVYQEVFGNNLMALARYESMKNFTRMQLEKLVRKNNPNWLSLYPISKTRLLFQVSA